VGESTKRRVPSRALPVATLVALALLATPAAVADAPVLNLPGDITGVEATGPSGAPVSFSVSATDDNPAPAISCDHSSGDTFPLGDTTVSCTATDTATSETTSGSFTVGVVDTTPPTVTAPAAPAPVEATGPSGAVVNYGAASATDLVDGSVPVTCAPASGSTFPLGTTSVTCSATDAHGNEGTASFDVTVQDTTPPTVTAPPAPGPAEATGPSGAVVTFGAASATDLVDGNVPAGCSPASGSTFPLGTTSVTCSATDSHGNTGTAAPFDVTVRDTTPPTLSVPGPITTEATGPGGAAVSFSASANDAVDGSVTPDCSASSGSTFPVGKTTVTCSATDSHHNTSAPKSFTVTVTDTTPPVVTVPAPITLEATGPSGAVATFTATASDIVDGSIAPTCSPASGSSFPITTTTVTCQATDSHGNKGSASFTVTVHDTTPPTISDMPADKTVEADGPRGTQVRYTLPVAVDLVDGPLVPVCTPASGVYFGLGTTTVDCTASDSHGNATSKSFSVKVEDTTKPVLNVPHPISVSTGGADHISRSDPKVAAFLSAATAVDLVDGPVAVTNNAPAELPLGTTAITFSATDRTGNTATAQSALTVVTGSVPQQKIDSTPPHDVTHLKAKAGNRSVQLSWTPPATDFDHVTVSRSPGGALESEIVVYKGSARRFLDKHLVNGVEYRYVVVAWDSAGNRSAGVAARAVPERELLVAPTNNAVVSSPPILRWLPVPGASYYNVQLYRLSTRVGAGILGQPGLKVLSAWPRKTQISLAGTWRYNGRVRRLTLGRYVWYVWPGFGPRSANRYGALLGQSQFGFKPKPKG
jgi:hypothetical protein